MVHSQKRKLGVIFFIRETFPETMKLIVLKQGWCGWTTSPLLSTWPTPADGFRHRPVPILPIYDLWFRPGTPGKNCGVIKVNLNLRGSMLVSCSFNWTRCANRKSTTKSWDQTQWGSWAKSFFRYRSGISLLKTGSPSSPGQSLTSSPVCLVGTMCCSAAQESAQLQTATFLAAKR